MRFALSATVAVASLALPAIAHADTIDSFSLLAPGLSVSFSAPASPTPIDTGSFYGTPLFFGIGPLTFVENGISHSLAEAYFFSNQNLGGFSLETATQQVIDGLSFTGAQLYKGKISSPTFKTGTFDLSNVYTGDSAELTISPVTATPEPGSLALLGTGALAAVGVLRRRFVR